MEAACANALDVASKVSGQKGATDWNGVVGLLDEATEWMEREYSLVAHMHAVAATKEWDEANRRSLEKLVGVSTAIGQDRGIYERLVSLRDKKGDSLGAGRMRILSDIIAGFELSGVGLGEKARKEFAKNETRLSALGSSFEEHVREATAAWSESVTDEEALGNMPADMRDAARQKDGWRFSLLDPSYHAYMTHGTDRGLRKRMCEARNARASDLGEKRLDNTPLVGEILALRYEQATALGYPDPASMILSRRMAKTPSAVKEFLSGLTKKSRQAGKKEMARLSSFAKKELGIDKLEPWDMAFVVERFRERETGISDAQLRPYFGSARVMEGMFECAGKLFGISARPARDVPVWHKKVSSLLVDDEGGNNIGRLYLDLYARKQKRGGAWAHGSQARCRFNGNFQAPSALMNCNFTVGKNGGKDKDPRLGWQEVITLFHEAGHALHHLLGKVDDFCASGMNGVEWDAVELPSQFMECFAWRPEVAIGMSSHVDTKKPLPKRMFEKLEAQRAFLPGLFLTRQVSFATYDLALHTEKGADPQSLWEKTRNKIQVVPGLMDDRFFCSFGHIFAGGYASGYYGYLWAEVLAADAYEMFTKKNANLPSLGRKFSEEVLERGGTRDAAENFRALLGRDPDPAALLRKYKLA